MTPLRAYVRAPAAGSTRAPPAPHANPARRGLLRLRAPGLAAPEVRSSCQGSGCGRGGARRPGTDAARTAGQEGAILDHVSLRYETGEPAIAEHRRLPSGNA